MRRDELIRLLQSHREEISDRFGVRSLAVFGSHARDEARPDSDVDLLVEFEGSATWEGYNQLLDYLEDLTGAEVDLAFPSKLKPRLRAYVEQEMIRVA